MRRLFLSGANRRRERGMSRKPGFLWRTHPWLRVRHAQIHGGWGNATQQQCDSPHENTSGIFTAKCARIFLVRSARLCHQRVFQMLIFHSTFGHFTHPNVKFPDVHERSKVTMLRSHSFILFIGKFSRPEIARIPHASVRSSPRRESCWKPPLRRGWRGK